MCLADGTVESFQMNIPRINTEYVGSGDLFAALLLAWMHQHPHDLKVGHLSLNFFLPIVEMIISLFNCF